MLFIMKIKRIIFYTICLFSINQIVAQTNNLTNSPYSLYGLGVSNGLNTGKTNIIYSETNEGNS